MTTRTNIVAFVLALSLACGGDDDGGNVDDCDATFNGNNFNEETCKAVALIVDCMDVKGVEADDLDDDALRAEIDACAAQFNFCATDPLFEDHPALATFDELRGTTNMCVG